MTRPFLSVDALLTFHSHLIGLPNQPVPPHHYDFPLLEGAVKAVEQLACFHPDADVFDIAAAYAFHISKAHAFQNANKRTAFMGVLYYLHCEGLNFVQPGDPLAVWIRCLVLGWLTREQVALRLRFLGEDREMVGRLDEIDRNMNG